ncbi:fimbrial protein [Pseudomonas sp. FP818]|uniref:fimbrial protein n=1 Tax=Pseudomonas sp. FP818 TaxID=2954099 RepID=UPI00273353C4|nr:fimbrial protein [Pseudomonas sp. FP818]WLI37162.1 fimbrial protein [Pseudomonas sp. FP818]
MNVYRVSIWISILIAFLTISAHSVVHAAGGSNTVVTLPGGRVAVFGAVTTGACSVSISNSDKIVLMGTVRSNQFTGVGSDSQAVPFSIQLDDCNSNVSESVGISFSGIANEEDLQVLAINGGTDAAQGIGLALFDADNQLLAVNADPVEYAPLSKGMNTLSFFAKYRLVEKFLRPGIANATADFTLVYQ